MRRPPFAPIRIGRGIGSLEGSGPAADTDAMVTRAAREESGFGLIELVIAITMLNVGILAIVAAFNSGAIALGRASKVSNAAALADTQMELYRGLKYGNIVFDTTEWNSAKADANYTNDSVYQSYMANPVAPKALVPSI